MKVMSKFSTAAFATAVFAGAMSFSVMSAQAFVFNTPNENVFAPPFGSLFDTKTENQASLDASGSIAFNQALNEGYAALSDERGNAWKEPDWDFIDAELFKWKARTAARNARVVAENPLDRDLTDDQRAEFTAAYERMHRAFERGGRYEAPKDAGAAQVAYDCWMEATEAGRGADASRCKADFEAALRETEYWSDYKLTEVSYPEREQAAAAEPAVLPQSFLVYFDFDKSDLRPEGARVVSEVIDVANT